MRAWSAILVAAAVGGCTSVRVVQRDGCWVKRTSGPFHKVHEELGFCARPPPAWAEDRVTRLAQECVVRADYQWQTRALAAWNRGEPLPPQDPEDRVLQHCMTESSRIMAEENSTLKLRLAEAAGERDALRASSEQERSRLRETLDKVTEQLGEAARKPAPPAYATATASSEGRSEATAPPASATAPVTVLPASPPAAAPGPAPTPLPSRRAPAPAPAICPPDAGGGTRQARSGKPSAPAACVTPQAALDPGPPGAR
jgi:hypothetical protein